MARYVLPVHMLIATDDTTAFQPNTDPYGMQKYRISVFYDTTDGATSRIFGRCLGTGLPRGCCRPTRLSCLGQQGTACDGLMQAFKSTVH